MKADVFFSAFRNFLRYILTADYFFSVMRIQVLFSHLFFRPCIL